MALPQLTLRTTKGSALTYAEADANFTNLSTGTIRVAVGSTTTTLSLNDTITFSTGTGMTITANSSTKTITFASSGGGSGITDIVNDTSPQLGGNLDVNGFAIVTNAGSNASITLTPDGTGIVTLNTAEVRVGDVGAAAYITSQGAGNLVLGTNYSSGTSSYITVNHGVNANIDLNPSGTGDLNVNADTLRLGDSGAQATITTNGAGDLLLNTNAGTNSGSITIGNGASGNITIAADGTGDIHLNSNAIRVGRNNSTVAELATAGTTPLKIYPNEGSTGQPFINISEGANGAITIASTGSGNISLTTGTGSVSIAGQTWPTTKGSANQFLLTNGAGTLSWSNLTTATASVVGGITIGNGLSITGAGVASVNATVLSTATSAALGVIKIGSGLSAASDGTISATAQTPVNVVSSITFGSTGLTPSTASTGTVVVGGVLNVGNGGTGTSENASAGKVLISNGSNYVPAYITAGSGISITTGSGTMSIAATGGTSAETVYALTWSATPAFTFSSGTVVTTTINATATSLTFTGAATGQTVAVLASYSNSTLYTLPASSSTLKYANGNRTLSCSTLTQDLITISYIGSTYYVGITRGYQ